MSSIASRRILGMLTAILAAGLFALPAGAQTTSFQFTGSDFYVPRPAAASDQVGVLRLLTSFDLAANGYGELIGQVCSFEVDASNGESVHVNNYAAIITGGEETDVYETEAAPNVTETLLEDATLTLGDSIELYNVMLPDSEDIMATSVEFTVIVTCTTEETTTTTEPTTTTTEPTTTTTVPVTTTTSVLGTTTTTAPEAEATSTTTTVPSVSPSTLPFTGPPVEPAGLAVAGAALMLLGGGALFAARRQS